MSAAQLQQFVRDHDAGNSLLMENLGNARAQHVNVADERRLLHSVLIHPSAQFMDFARVEANLINDEMGAALDLLLEFQPHFCLRLQLEE